MVVEVGDCSDMTRPSGPHIMGCPSGQCGGNSPHVNVFPVVGVNLGSPTPCKNVQGVRTKVVPANGTCARAVAIAVRVHRREWGELVGVDAHKKVVCEGSDLVGARVTFTYGDVTPVRAVTAVVLRSGRIGARPSDPIAYVLAPEDYWLHPEETEHEWASLCDARAASEFAARLLPPSPSAGAPQHALRPQRPHIRSAQAKAVGTLSPAEAAAAVIILPGEAYDSGGNRHVPGPPPAADGAASSHVTQWYNFACAGDSMAKVSLLRQLAFDGDISPAALNERQAAVRMETGIYCKGIGKEEDRWRSRTVRGIALCLDKGSAAACRAGQHGDLRGTVREGIWNQDGVVCLDKPRIYSPDRLIQKGVLPGLCYEPTAAVPVDASPVSPSCDAGLPVDAGVDARAPTDAGVDGTSGAVAGANCERAEKEYREQLGEECGRTIGECEPSDLKAGIWSSWLTEE